MTQATTAKRSKPKGADLLRLIGAFKLLKGAFLIVAAIAAFNLVHKDLAEVIAVWQHRLHIAPGNIYVEHLIEKALTVKQSQLVLVGSILLAYAAMFTVEGVGLILLKHWAEWMTVITTSALIPIEVYEMIHKPGWLKAAAMVINIVVAVYLVFHVRNEIRARKAEAGVE